jgi:hypothetical protein
MVGPVGNAPTSFVCKTNTLLLSYGPEIGTHGRSRTCIFGVRSTALYH